ncbi:chaplin family protein, partial [Streptomyces sp900105755]|uniref:chaplin family protein n=1 Tax=Streptomyces sp. 900105755 TaxID=3154389 RepID=UPI003331E5EB
MSRIAKGLVLSTAAVAAVAGGAAAAVADSGASSAAAHSPGVLWGFVLEFPIHVRFNV